MKKFIGAMAAMAVLGLAAGVQAQGEDIGGDTSSGQGGSGSTMAGPRAPPPARRARRPGTMGQQQQLEGKVLKADKSSITIEHMGAAIR
jgi:hypothetical protein